MWYYKQIITINATKYVRIFPLTDDITPLIGARYYPSTGALLPSIIKILRDKAIVWKLYNIREFLSFDYRAAAYS